METTVASMASPVERTGISVKSIGICFPPAGFIGVCRMPGSGKAKAY